MTFDEWWKQYCKKFNVPLEVNFKCIVKDAWLVGYGEGKSWCQSCKGLGGDLLAPCVQCLGTGRYIK